MIQILKGGMALTFLCFASVAVHAVEPDEVLDDAVLEERARTIGKELRCVVCKSQSIEDSDAPLARDLRILLRERLAAGDSDQAAIDYVVERYGDFVLLKPPLQSNTVLLWGMPIGFAVIGGLTLLFLLRKRMHLDEEENDENDVLSPDESSQG